MFQFHDQHLHGSPPLRYSTISLDSRRKSYVSADCPLRLGIRRVQFSCAVSAFGHDRRAAALFIKTFVWRNGRKGKVYSHPNRSRPKWLLESCIAPLCTLLKMVIGPPGHHHLFWPQGCISALLCSPLGMNRSGTRCGRYWVVVYNG